MPILRGPTCLTLGPSLFVNPVGNLVPAGWGGVGVRDIIRQIRIWLRRSKLWQRFVLATGILIVLFHVTSSLDIWAFIGSGFLGLAFFILWILWWIWPLIFALAVVIYGRTTATWVRNLFRDHPAVAWETLLAVLLGAGGFGATVWLESRLEEQSVVRENLRFVREIVIDDALRKPLAEVNLEGAPLIGLDLSCEDRSTSGLEAGCAQLSGANLVRADVSFTNLTGANLSGGELSGAMFVASNLSGVDLSGADLVHADLREANLTGASLSGANLSRAHLEHADLSRVCYSEETVWPEKFTPPEPQCS